MLSPAGVCCMQFMGALASSSCCVHAFLCACIGFLLMLHAPGPLLAVGLPLLSNCIRPYACLPVCICCIIVSPHMFACFMLFFRAFPASTLLVADHRLERQVHSLFLLCCFGCGMCLLHPSLIFMLLLGALPSSTLIQAQHGLAWEGHVQSPQLHPLLLYRHGFIAYYMRLLHAAVLHCLACMHVAHNTAHLTTASPSAALQTALFTMTECSGQAQHTGPKRVTST